jgi:hypothetical protein
MKENRVKCFIIIVWFYRGGGGGNLAHKKKMTTNLKTVLLIKINPFPIL